MARMTRKELLKRDEIQETAADVGHWMERHWRTVAQAGVALVAVAAVAGLVLWYLGHRREQASAALGDGVQQFTQATEGAAADRAKLEAALASFDRALAGGPAATTRRVAEYYRAATLHRLDRNEDAADALETLAGRAELPPTLEGAALALHARVLAETGGIDRAIEIVERLVERPSPGFPEEHALLELGRLRHERGDRDAARAAWQRIVDEFPATGASQEARRLLGG